MGGYQRLRVGETTDELARIIASAAGFSMASDESLAIQYVVRAWRIRHFAPRPGPNQDSENRYLLPI